MAVNAERLGPAEDAVKVLLGLDVADRGGVGQEQRWAGFVRCRGQDDVAGAGHLLGEERIRRHFAVVARGHAD